MLFTDNINIDFKDNSNNFVPIKVMLIFSPEIGYLKKKINFQRRFTIWIFFCYIMLVFSSKIDIFNLKKSLYFRDYHLESLESIHLYNFLFCWSYMSQIGIFSKKFLVFKEDTFFGAILGETSCSHRKYQCRFQRRYTVFNKILVDLKERSQLFNKFGWNWSVSPDMGIFFSHQICIWNFKEDLHPINRFKFFFVYTGNQYF